MQMVTRIFFYTLFVWFALVWLMPKEALYFKLEQHLSSKGIKINEAAIEEGMISLSIRDGEIFLRGIRIARFENASIVSLFVYSHIHIDQMKTVQGLPAIPPLKADWIDLTHTVASPRQIRISAKGSFGSLTGTIDLYTHHIFIRFTELKELGVLRRELKKDAKGWYYENTY